MNIDNIIKKCLDKHIQRNILTEYSADQRLPFDDDKFKNKNYLEQYIDWLEDFGKYGELSSSKLNFLDEIKKAINYIINNNLRNHAGLGLPNNFEMIYNDLRKKIIGNNLVFNEKGNVYVERQVKINNTSNSYDISDKNGKDPKILYNTLVKNYNNNVGGCWSYKMNGSNAYCSYDSGDSITLKGFIRTDDIDFVKTVLLNFHYPNEHEIRVKPNAKVELFEVDFNCKYKIPLNGRLIVNSTYFGNNGVYNGDYAKVDDGFGNFDYIDRHGRISKINDIVLDIISKGGNLENFFEEVEILDNNLYKVKLDDKYSILTLDNGLIDNGKTWFDSITEFFINGLYLVKLDDKYSLMDVNINLTNNGKIWFEWIDNDFINKFSENFILVQLYRRYSLINVNDNMLVFDDKVWFDEIENFYINLVKVKLNNKYALIKINDDNLVFDDKVWFDEIENFYEGLAKVKLDNKYSFINNEGKLIFDSNLWFDKAEFLGDKLGGMIEKNGQRYLFDKNMNFYDYKTKQQIQNPFNKNNESFDKYINHIIYECFEKLINKKN